MREHHVRVERVGHGAVSEQGNANGGLRREVVQEGEERQRREMVGVEVNEVDDVMGGEGRKQLLKAGGINGVQGMSLREIGAYGLREGRECRVLKGR